MKWFILAGWPVMFSLAGLAALTKRECFGWGYAACGEWLPAGLAVLCVAILVLLVHAIHKQKHRR